MLPKPRGPNCPAARQKFPRKGASRLHPHPTHPTGPGPVPRVPGATSLGAGRIDAPEAYLDGLSSDVEAVLQVGHPHPEGLLSHRAGDPRMIGTRSVPMLRHERQRAERQPAIRVRLGQPLDGLAR